jgi:WD40 repeat protein
MKAAGVPSEIGPQAKAAPATAKLAHNPELTPTQVWVVSIADGCMLLEMDPQTYELKEVLRFKSEFISKPGQEPIQQLAKLFETMIITGGTDGAVKVWSYPEVKSDPLVIFDKHGGKEINDFDVSKDGSLICSCAMDKTIEARNCPFCPSQEKFHTVVLRGV